MVLTLTFIDDLFMILTLIDLQGVAYGIYLVSGNVFVTQEAPPEHRGAAMGVYSSFANAGNVIGPLISGSIAELYGLKLTLQLSAFVAFLGSVSAIPLIYSKK